MQLRFGAVEGNWAQFPVRGTRGISPLGAVTPCHPCRYFNYRTTRFLAEEGFYKFHNWFDDRAWYPLGRIIGGTIYPGEAFAKLKCTWCEGESGEGWRVHP